MDYVSRPEEIFHDSQVTNLNFLVGKLHVYAFLYRRNNLKEITSVSRKFSSQLRACGLSIKRKDGNDFYEWMSKWFNPQLLISMDFDIIKPKNYEFVRLVENF